jgi:hypothetical protein
MNASTSFSDLPPQIGPEAVSGLDSVAGGA